jgi:hypothetical protein
MKRLIKFTKINSFQVKWLFMSNEDKYAYFWNKTRKLAIPVVSRK